MNLAKHLFYGQIFGYISMVLISGTRTKVWGVHHLQRGICHVLCA